MLTLVKRLLSYLHDDGSESTEPGRGRRRSSATSHLFTKDSPAARQSGEAARPGKAAAARPKPQINPDFDPYHTGKFDRGASWERISKNQR